MGYNGKKMLMSCVEQTTGNSTVRQLFKISQERKEAAAGGRGGGGHQERKREPICCGKWIRKEKAVVELLEECCRSPSYLLRIRRWWKKLRRL